MHRLLYVVLLTLMSVTAHASVPPPATIVVAFDQDTITPLIVEGVRNRETSEPVEANDPVRIASISKMLMALVTLRLAHEGTVDLDADVADYLGWDVHHPGFPEARITLAQLLSHRAGLRDDAGYIIPFGESLETRLADPGAWNADAPPGEAPFEYANLGSPVVATVLEAATGERYDRLLERTVFAPLEIEACLNWIGCSRAQIARAVALYRDTGEPARDYPGDLPPDCTIPVAEGVACSLADYVPGTNASVFSPQGGVRIGMMDLAKIGQAWVNADPRLLPDSAMAPLLAVMETPANVGQEFFCFYALHHQMIDLPHLNCDDKLFGDGTARIGHAGEAYGLRAGLWIDPIARSGIAYFTTAVPPRASAEDEGGFDPREIELMQRARALVRTHAR